MSSEDAEIIEEEDDEGDMQNNFTKYVENNKADPKSVDEYRKISNIERVIVPIGLLVGVGVYMVIMAAMTGEVGFMDFSDLESTILSISLVGVAGLIAVALVWYVTDLSISHELDDRQLARHKLALSIESYQSSNMPKTMEHLEEVMNNLGGIAHPQLASVTSDLISNYADPNDSSSIDLIMSDYVGHIIESDRHARLGSEFSEDLYYGDQESVTYFGVILDDVWTRVSGKAGDLMILSISFVAILLIYFYVSQGLAGVLGTLVAAYGPYLLVQRGN